MSTQGEKGEQKEGEMMGRTSAEVKNRYNEKAYDRIAVVVPKGQKEVIKAYAAEQGESVNAFINRLIEQEMKKGGE